MGDSNDKSDSMQPPILQSKDHGQLLDVIDQLRSLGMDRHVPLPQLVVCGDQNSGKSSVLEAISGVRFPTKETLCTRFATELILRRDPATSVSVKIRPSEERSAEEKMRLSDFQAPTTDVDRLSDLIEAAKNAMGLSSEGMRFSEDILRIELSSPTQPHLTLVDLPGLFHSPNKQQTAEDAVLVKNLVRSYMANKRSIILAVVTAKNDYANQLVTDMAREYDLNGARTLGIITKPDTLLPGSDSERSFFGLARNDDVAFRLGWHVLRNRDFDTKDHTVAQRDLEEEKFFAHGIWTSLPATSLGIKPLQSRLSNVLRDQILAVLPSLIADVESGIRDCDSRLSKLGVARETIVERRLYLVRVSQTFSSLIKAAIDGVYADDFFGDAMTDDGYNKRLRASVNNLLLKFAEDVRLKGKSQVIVDGESRSNLHDTNKINRSDYLDHVGKLMSRSRGRELPGTFNPLIIGDLFFEQSKPWAKLAEKYCKRILEAIQTALQLMIDVTADSTTSEGLLTELLYPAVEGCSQTLHDKVKELIRPHQRGHPITYNHYFTETIQDARRAFRKDYQTRRINKFFGCRTVGTSQHVTDPSEFDTGALVDSLGQPSEKNMDRYACSEASDCMEAYYKVAMKVFVDNFAVLAVENCVLDQLTDVLSPEKILKLEDTVVDSIAGETEASQLERRRTQEKVGTLNDGLVILNRFGRQHASGTNEHASFEDSGSISRAPSPVHIATDEEVEDTEPPPELATPTAQEDVILEAAPQAEIVEATPDGWGFGSSKKKKGKKTKGYSFDEPAAPEESEWSNFGFKG